jgi:hypothetical protein
MGELIPMPVPCGPWQHVSMDFVSGFPPSRGWDCVLVVVHHHSKGVRLFPMKTSAKAEDVADVLLSGVVAVTGPLLSIHSDRGTTFTSDVLRAHFRRVRHRP